MRICMAICILSLVSCGINRNHNLKRTNNLRPENIRITQFKRESTEYQQRSSHRSIEVSYIKSIHLNQYDSVIVYADSIVVSRFRARNNRIIDSLLVFYPNGTLAAVVPMIDADEKNEFDDIFFSNFIGRRNGRCSYYYPSGGIKSIEYFEIKSIEYFKVGKINSFKVFTDTNRNTTSRYDFDTLLYGDSKSPPLPKGYVKETSVYKVCQYYPNGILMSEECFYSPSKIEPCLSWKKYDTTGSLISTENFGFDAKKNSNWQLPLILRFQFRWNQEAEIDSLKTMLSGELSNVELKASKEYHVNYSVIFNSGSRDFAEVYFQDNNDKISTFKTPNKNPISRSGPVLCNLFGTHKVTVHMSATFIISQ